VTQKGGYAEHSMVCGKKTCIKEESIKEKRWPNLVHRKTKKNQGSGVFEGEVGSQPPHCEPKREFHA